MESGNETKQNKKHLIHLAFTGVWLLVYTVVLHFSVVDPLQDCCSPAFLLPQALIVSDYTCWLLQQVSG